ncbi:MAG: hypothetical protein ACREER_00695 [Alphaproteobacteria bacterium]
MRLGALAALAAVVLAFVVRPALAETLPGARLPVPTGEAILVISGAITRTTDGVAALFDRSMLEVIATADGQDVSGPRWFVPLDALFAYVGAHGTAVEARTFDEQRVRFALAGLTDDTVLVVEPTAASPGAAASTKARVALGLPAPDGDSDATTVIDRVIRLRID